MEQTKNIFSTLVLEQNPSYVEELEKKYNIELPPVFKAFVQTFEFGKFIEIPEHTIIHPNNEIGYSGFELSLEENLIVYDNQGDYYKSNHIIPIASSIYQGGICIGISEDNADKVLLYIDGLDEKLRLISSDILQFIKQFELVNWSTI